MKVQSTWMFLQLEKERSISDQQQSTLRGCFLLPMIPNSIWKTCPVYQKEKPASVETKRGHKKTLSMLHFLGGNNIFSKIMQPHNTRNHITPSSKASSPPSITECFNHWSIPRSMMTPTKEIRLRKKSLCLKSGFMEPPNNWLPPGRIPYNMVHQKNQDSLLNKDSFRRSSWTFSVPALDYARVWARSSVVEHVTDNDGVDSSILSAPTKKSPAKEIFCLGKYLAI
jgi:hypothetical protein